MYVFNIIVQIMRHFYGMDCAGAFVFLHACNLQDL